MEVNVRGRLQRRGGWIRARHAVKMMKKTKRRKIARTLSFSMGRRQEMLQIRCKYAFIHLFICPVIHQSIHTSVHLFIHPSIHPPIHLTIHLSTIHPSINPSNHPPELRILLVESGAISNEFEILLVESGAMTPLGIYLSIHPFIAANILENPLSVSSIVNALSITNVDKCGHCPPRGV